MVLLSAVIASINLSISKISKGCYRVSHSCVVARYDDYRPIWPLMGPRIGAQHRHKDIQQEGEGMSRGISEDIVPFGTELRALRLAVLVWIFS